MLGQRQYRRGAASAAAARARGDGAPARGRRAAAHGVPHGGRRHARTGRHPGARGPLVQKGTPEALTLHFAARLGHMWSQDALRRGNGHPMQEELTALGYMKPRADAALAQLAAARAAKHRRRQGVEERQGFRRYHTPRGLQAGAACVLLSACVAALHACARAGLACACHMAAADATAHAGVHAGAGGAQPHRERPAEPRGGEQARPVVPRARLRWLAYRPAHPAWQARRPCCRCFRVRAR